MLSAGAAALTIACLAGGAQATTLVVRSAGPSAASYPPGTTLADSARIVLQSNDQILLLDGRGTRILKGPGSFSPLAATSSGIDTRSTFAALVGQRSDRRARIGAVRGMTAAPAPAPDIWSVDIARSATVCVADAASLSLWRDGTPPPTSATVTAADGAKAEVDWNDGAATTPWPSTLPVAAGASYSISWPGADQPTTVRFATIGAAPQGLEELASTLIRNGCDAQLDRLIAAVPGANGSAPSGG